MRFENLDAAVASLEFWQKRLRLQDWDITLSVNTKPIDTPKEQVNACIHYHTEQGKATIYLVDPAHLPDEVDQEFLIVHELLHLHTSWFDHSTEGSISQAKVEIAINRIAEALVKFRREVADNE